MIVAIGCILLYLTVGYGFEKYAQVRFGGGKFDVRTLLFWPFGIDIWFKGWFELRRIERDGKKKLAEVIAERDSKLVLLSIQWIGLDDEAVIIMSYDGETSAWRGSDMQWERPRDGERGSDWMRQWLHDRWEAALRDRS